MQVKILFEVKLQIYSFIFQMPSELCQHCNNKCISSKKKDLGPAGILAKGVDSLIKSPR